MALNLLIVDDSQTTRMILKKTINIIQLEINQFFEAENGVEALKILEKNEIDLVITDLNMPIMNGIEMIQAMKNDTKLINIPIIVISSQETEDKVEELARQSVTHFIRKPFEPIEIKEAIDNLLSFRLERFKENMFSAIEKVLEKTFFILPEEYKGKIEEVIEEIEYKDFYYLSLSFDGDIKGIMEYFMSWDTAQEMIGNLLGEQEIEDEKLFIEDNLREFASIVCGNFLSDNFPEKSVNLNIPPRLVKEPFTENIIRMIKDEEDKWNILMLEDKFLFYRIKFGD